MTSDPQVLKVREMARVDKYDCAGEQRQLIETVICVDGRIIARTSYDPPISCPINQEEHDAATQDRT